MNYHVLYNPLAGNGGHNVALDRLSSIYGRTLSAHDITKITDYKEFFAPLGEDDSVILAGGDGTLNKLMKNDSVYNSVDSLLNDVNDLVKKIKENPKKYLKISVF